MFFLDNLQLVVSIYFRKNITFARNKTTQTNET